ncbi:MAG: hypothetical protein KF901_28675 [Myxococcales bacterium]|nr:hypothetical protein [Myxococcales bacterium]
MMSPTDGTELASTSSAVSFSGYATSASQEVQVEAFNPSTRAWVAIASPVPASGATQTLWGSQWHGWSLNRAIPSVYWTPGAAGASARVRARLTTGNTVVSGHEDAWTCLAQSGSSADFVERCTVPETTICTSNFLPFSARRSPCPPRSLRFTPTSGARTYVRLPDATTTGVIPTATRTIEWRGDAASFVDLFDAIPGPEGFSRGGVNVVRVRYPSDRNVDAHVRVDPVALSASVPRPIPPGFGAARTYRQYDVGECSLFMGWRNLLTDSIAPALEESLRGIVLPEIGAVDVYPLSRLELFPVLRSDGQDAVRFAGRFNLVSHSLGDLGNALIAINVRITARGGRITATVEPDASNVVYDPQGFGALGIAFGVRTREQVETRIRTRIAAEIPNRLTALLPAQAALVAIDRVDVRVDGMNVVLAETRQDTQYDLLRLAGLCNRPAILPGGNEAGILFSYFDPPSPGDPRPLGETRP